MNLKVVSAKIEVPSCMEIWKEQFRKKVVFKKEIKKKRGTVSGQCGLL